ncbi:hypothetical protein K402DRAFT_152431 [Aulographum hederae CBS 113979]|uniref:Uncharacterized protein n=1 Tax=Aulographum hederae CBS 113979 TaxID=1176131 RepID=A0A6G1GT56_9PEZI|nr:hypothetical protein K402DRAFT_152431 [Aulographum hederae CBS 113979]
MEFRLARPTLSLVVGIFCTTSGPSGFNTSFSGKHSQQHLCRNHREIVSLGIQRFLSRGCILQHPRGSQQHVNPQVTCSGLHPAGRL